MTTSYRELDSVGLDLAVKGGYEPLLPSCLWRMSGKYCWKRVGSVVALIRTTFPWLPDQRGIVQNYESQAYVEILFMYIVNHNTCRIVQGVFCPSRKIPVVQNAMDPRSSGSWFRTGLGIQSKNKVSPLSPGPLVERHWLQRDDKVGYR